MSSNLKKEKYPMKLIYQKNKICGTIKIHHVHVHELLFAIWGAIFNIRNAF